MSSPYRDPTPVVPQDDDSCCVCGHESSVVACVHACEAHGDTIAAAIRADQDAKTRAGIVAWLRKEAPDWNAERTILNLVDAIEVGADKDGGG